MDSSDCSNNSESINSLGSSHLIELRKTSDITLVKGWRNKQFKVSNTKELNECRNYTLLCDDLKNYDNDDLVTEDNDLINLDSLRVILSNDHYKKIGEQIKSSYNSDFMQNLANKIDKDKLSTEEIKDKSSELDCKIDKNSKNLKLSSFVNKNEKFLSHPPLSQKKSSKVENTSVKLDSKSETRVSDDETSISYRSRTSTTRSSLNLDQDHDPFTQKPRTVFERRLLYETESRNKNSSKLVSADELRRDFQYIDKYKKYDNNFRMKEVINVSNDPCIDDKVIVNENEKPTSHMVFNGNSYKVTPKNKLKDIASNKKTSVVSRRISKKMLKREKLKSASRRLKRLSQNPYLTSFHRRLDENTTALLENYTSIAKGNEMDYKNDKRKPVMVIHLGIGRCLFKEQVTNISLLRKQDHVISEKWAKYSVSTVVDKRCKNELTKFMVPVVFPTLIQLMEKSDKLRLGLSSSNTGDKVISDNLFSVDKNENLSVKSNKCINENLSAVDKKENLSVNNKKINTSVNDIVPTVDKNQNLSIENNESSITKEDNHASLALSEKYKLDSESVINGKPKDKLSTNISDKTISLSNVKSKISRKLQNTDKVHHEESERKLIGMYDTSSIRNILSEMSAQTEASDKNCIKEDSIDKTKPNFKGINNNRKKINSTKTDTSLLSDISKDLPADPSVKTDKIGDGDICSQISQTVSDVSESSPTKNLNFSNRVVDKSTGRVKYTGKQRRVALELKRLNSDFLEIDDSSKENSGENLNDSSNPDDVSNSISSDNLKSILPADIVKKLAKFEKDYHQTVMKSKDKMIFVSKYSERTKRTKKLPKKLEDTVWLGKYADFFEKVMKYEGIGNNDIFSGKKKHDNCDEKIVDSIKNCNKLNDSDAEQKRKNILQKDPIIKEKGLSSIATDKHAVRHSDLIQINGGEKLGKSDDVHPAALEESKKLYFGGKVSFKGESTDSEKIVVGTSPENYIKIPYEVQSVDLKQSNKIQMEGKVISRRRNHNFKNINGVKKTDISGNQKDSLRLRKMNGFKSISCNESDKLLGRDMKSTSKVEDNDEKELNELKSRILKYNESNLRPIETQSMTEVLENRPSDIVDSKLSSKTFLRENSVLVQTAKSILKPVHLRAGNINDVIGLRDKEIRKGILPEKYLIVKVEKIKIPDKVHVWCMDHNQYYCFCLKRLEKSKNVAKKRIHPLFSSESKRSKQPALNTLITEGNDRHDSLKFLKGYSGSAIETDYTKSNNTNIHQNISKGQTNFTLGCLNNGKRNDNSVLIKNSNQIDLSEINTGRNSGLAGKTSCWNNDESSDNSSLINETNQICVNRFNIVDPGVSAGKKILRENDANTDSENDAIIEEREDQPALIPRIESVMSLDPKEFYNDDICSDVDVSNTATTQSDKSNNCPSVIQENANETIVSPSITGPKLKKPVQNFIFMHSKNSVPLKENVMKNFWYKFFCIYVRKTKFSYLQFLGGPNNNVKIPYEGITDLLVEAIKEQKCFHRPIKRLGMKGFSYYHDLSFGMYAEPNECIVYFGPYGHDEPHMLQAFDISIQKTTKNSVSEESSENVLSRLLPFVAPAFESEFTVPYVLGSWWVFQNFKASQENIFSLLKAASKLISDSYPALSAVSVLKCKEQSQLSQSANEKNQSTGSNKIKLMSLQNKSLLITNRMNLNVSENKANKQLEPHNNNKVLSSSSVSKSTMNIPEKFKPPFTLKSIVKNTASTTSLNSPSGRNILAGEFKPLSPPFTVRSSAGNTIAETSKRSLVTDNSRENNPYKLNILASYSGLSSSAVKANEGKSASNDDFVNNIDTAVLLDTSPASADNSNVSTSDRPCSLIGVNQLEEETNNSNIESSDSKFVDSPSINTAAVSSLSTITSINKGDPILVYRQKKNMPILVNVLPDGNVIPAIPLQRTDQNGKKFYYYHNKVLDFGVDVQSKSIYGKNISAGDKSNKKAAPNYDVSSNSLQKNNVNTAINTSNGENSSGPLNVFKTSISDSVLNSESMVIRTAENLNCNNICNKGKELPNRKIVSVLPVRESGKKFKTNFVGFYPLSEAIPEFKRSKIATEHLTVKRLLPTDLGNKSGSIVSINADNSAFTTDSKFSKLMQEWELCQKNAKQLSITKLSSSGLDKKTNSIASIDHDVSMADSTGGKSFLESKPNNITSIQSSLKPLSIRIGNKTNSSDNNVADAINSVVHKFTTEAKLCTITTELPSSLSGDTTTESDSVMFVSDDNVITSNSSVCELPFQSKRSKIATEESSLSKLLSPRLLDRSDTVVLTSNNSGVSLVPKTLITKQASVSNNNIAHQEKSDVRVTLSSAVNNSSSLSTKASQKCEGKSVISKNVNGDLMIGIDDYHQPVSFMELAPLESTTTSINSKTTENLVRSTDAEQPHNIKLVSSCDLIPNFLASYGIHFTNDV